MCNEQRNNYFCFIAAFKLSGKTTLEHDTCSHSLQIKWNNETDVIARFHKLLVDSMCNKTH